MPISATFPFRPRIPTTGICSSNGRSILTLDYQGHLTQWTGERFSAEFTVAGGGDEHDSDCFSQDGRLLASPGPMAIFRFGTRRKEFYAPNDQHAWPRVAGILSYGRQEANRIFREG